MLSLTWLSLLLLGREAGEEGEEVGVEAEVGEEEEVEEEAVVEEGVEEEIVLEGEEEIDLEEEGIGLKVGETGLEEVEEDSVTD